MFNKLISLKTRVLGLIQNEDGVVAWEYLLVIAGVSVAIIFAIALAAPSLIAVVLEATCDSIETVIPTSVTMTCPSF